MAHMLPHETKLGLLYTLYPGLSWLLKQAVVYVAYEKVIPEEDSTTMLIMLAIYMINLILHAITDHQLIKLELVGKSRALLRTAML